jgi:hypothetical protein
MPRIDIITPVIIMETGPQILRFLINRIKTAILIKSPAIPSHTEIKKISGDNV